MKTKRVVFCLLAGGLMLTACVSKPRQLALSEIAGEVPLYAVNLYIGKDADEEGLGETALKKLFIEKMPDIIDILRAEGIAVNTMDFITEFYRVQNIEFKTHKILNITLHHYLLRLPEKPPTSLELSITLSYFEDGTMPMNITVFKQDESYKPGYQYQKTVRVQGI